jgi:hypothetical protein
MQNKIRRKIMSDTLIVVFLILGVIIVLQLLHMVYIITFKSNDYNEDDYKNDFNNKGYYTYKEFFEGK